MGQELDLLPAFKDGEILTIQRTVDGKNVMMVVVVQEPCSIGIHDGTTKKPIARLTVNGWMRVWGESSYADGRVERQRVAIDRLVNHLIKHCTDPDCPHRGVVEDEELA
jgi:hypothetical protein